MKALRQIKSISAIIARCFCGMLVSKEHDVSHRHGHELIVQQFRVLTLLAYLFAIFLQCSKCYHFYSSKSVISLNFSYNQIKFHVEFDSFALKSEFFPSIA